MKEEKIKANLSRNFITAKPIGKKTIWTSINTNMRILMINSAMGLQNSIKLMILGTTVFRISSLS